MPQPRARNNGAPATIDWDGQQLIAVNKNFLDEHPITKSRTLDECVQLRWKHGIEMRVVHGDDSQQYLPKPVEDIEEAAFQESIIVELRDGGWTEPTAIQMQVWPAALAGYDIFGIAPTGSGKTAAYVLPMIKHIVAQPHLRPNEGPVGLILVPTRELCEQVAGQASRFGRHHGLVCAEVVGGESQEEQERTLLGRVDVIVATPRRLIELVNKGKTNLLRTTYLVVDEADEMLERGLGDQVRILTTHIRPDRQLLLFSATWDDKMNDLSSEVFGRNVALEVRVGAPTLAACKDITQFFVGPKGPRQSLDAMVRWDSSMTKADVLREVIKRVQDGEHGQSSKILVFVNKLETIPTLTNQLKQAGLDCEGFSAMMQHEDRKRVLQDFKTENGERSILIGSDVLSRGHDFLGLGVVINYDMPTHLQTYVHRIGRTGRAGRAGTAITLLEENDLRHSLSLIRLLEATDQQKPRVLQDAIKDRWYYWEQYKNQATVGPDNPGLVRQDERPAAAGRHDAPQTSSGAKDGELRPGAEVEVHSLVGAVELNGSRGVCAKLVETSGRWEVRLANGDVKAFKVDNLKAISSVHAAEPQQSPPPPGLPPGWIQERDTNGRTYFIDLETQTAQWDAPAYVSGNWTRHRDRTGAAFWVSTSLRKSFSERDPIWIRRVDRAGRIYWCSVEEGLRFYESDEY